MVFRLDTWQLVLLLVVVVFGATLRGMVLGRHLSHRSGHLKEPFAVLQAALLGLVGLVLAFGLALGVGRDEARRVAVVDETNAIGTTYLRAQTLAEPMRTESIDLLKDYTDTSIRLSNAIPGSAAHRTAIADGNDIQRELWSLAGEALADGRRQRAAAVRRDAERDDRHGNRARVHAQQPGSRGRARGRGAGRSRSPSGSSLLPGDPRARRPARAARGRPHHDAAPRHLRPRPPTRGLIQVPDSPLIGLRAEMELPPAADAPPG